MVGPLLLVEDDDAIRASMRLALEDEGYEVVEAADGETAVRETSRVRPDVIVLDLMLPGMDGFECCRQIRRVSDSPVLIVSARGDSHDVVAGLEAGADDYIRKPFAVPELVARIRALRRRLRQAPSEPSEDRVERIVIGDLVIFPDRGEVEVDGREAQLTKTECRLLFELASHPGRVFSREALLERVWDYGHVGDGRIVDVHVRRLRAKIEKDPADPRRLVTVRGFGYRLETG
jgi:DNA-binding response OmpR family regulator